MTAPLIAGRGAASSDLLSPGEYKRLARLLREMQRQPADLVSPDAAEILRGCQPVVDEKRLLKLLGRGFLLSQVIERWQARAIWVISRADADYPRRLKARLREDAPAIIYGCGDMSLLNSGGLAVVGSRHVDDSLIEYTMAVGRLTAWADSTIVSGGAKGIDQAAMRGAWEAGGKVCGVLTDSLEKATMKREHRNLLLDGKLALISPYDPSAGFNVGNAMQRNKLIYALADASLVVSSDFKKGGTWAGAIEQLDQLKFVPVFVRSTGESSDGLDALERKGALPWPNPQDVDSFTKVFNVKISSGDAPPMVDFQLFDGVPSRNITTTASASTDPALLPKTKSEPSTLIDIFSASPPHAAANEKSPLSPLKAISPTAEAQELINAEPSAAETLFSAVRAAIQQLLNVPMKDAEVAAALKVSNVQTKVWLKRLVGEGVIEKQNKPAGYVLKQKRLFEK